MATVLYICGISYCGSTLLTMLLNAHPEITTVGELTGPIWGSQKPPSEYICSCGAVLEECAFWSRLREEARTRGLEFDFEEWDLHFELGRSRLEKLVIDRSLIHNGLHAARESLLAAVPASRRRLAELGERNRIVIESALCAGGARIFVDSSKDPIRVRHLNRTSGLDVKVVHLSRDSLGFVNSDRGKNGASPGWSVDASIRNWNRTAARIERLRHHLADDQFTRVRYEDLCESPEASLRQLTDFVGVAPFEHPVRFREADHHVIGNPMRKRRAEAEIELDVRWRTELTPDEIQKIEARTAPDRARFGHGGREGGR